jgi:glycosyltransferase involved in cell wall biosynthesis
MPKSILLDATHFATREPTGVELYTDELLPHLSRLLMESSIEVHWIGHDETQPNGMPNGVVWHYSAYAPFWSQRKLAKELTTLKPGLFFTPSGLPPLRTKIPTALTIHDLAVYHYPKAFSSSQRLRLARLSRLAASRASLVLSPSAYTQSEVISRWEIPPNKTVVTPLAPFAMPIEAEDVALTGTAPIILFIGRVELKKNLLTLLEAFSKLKPGSARLIVAGGDGFGATQIRSLYRHLPEEIRSEVFFPGYITAAQKRDLYEMATIAVMPGAVEGFGLPVLESFQYGVPVLCAKSGSLPEVGGEAALYAEASDVADWKNQLERLLSDKTLRENCIKKGRERLNEFSWEQTAKKTATALLGLLK